MEQNKKSGGTHTVMTKKLAEALMDAGMQHFDAGGVPQTQSFGQHSTRNLGFSDSSFMGQAGSQIDSLQGMNLYNAQAPGIQQQNFQPQIAGTQATQANTYQNQNMLAKQLLAQSQGQGPNPAQAQLNQATGNNVQTQGALMASQRGANANPALMARQAAQQGASTQQQAAGQAATLGAQQQLGAQGALAGVYQNQAQNALSAEQIQQQGQAAQNSAINQGSLGAQTINANASGQNAQRVGGMQTGFQNAIGGMMGMLSKGGKVTKLSDGGPAPSLTPYQNFWVDPDEGKMGHKEKSPSSPGGNNGMSMAGGPGDAGGASGPGEGMMMASKGGFANYLSGGNIPGKASVKGDSKKNDTVPAMLSPGEIVLPRTVTEGPDMEKKALEFLRHLKGVQKKGYGGVISARGGKC